MENEVWKDIEGYGGNYQVSSWGRVRRIFKNGAIKILAYKMQGKRQTVRLRKKDKEYNYWRVVVANLVAQAFIPKEHEWQDFVEHIDGNTKNNHVENLKWSNRTNEEIKKEYSKIANLKGKNKYYIKDGIAHVELHNTKKEMICDADIWMKYKDRTWNEHCGYAKTNINRKEIPFHRLVKPCPEGYVIDHINRDRFDNRTINLRVTTQYVNMLNKSVSRRNRLKEKGVYKDGNSYRADITINKKRIYLGNYKTFEEAVKARKEAEEKYHNPFIEKETLH